METHIHSIICSCIYGMDGIMDYRKDN